MAVERTLSIIKPDAVAKNVIGEIYARFEKSGLRIAAARMMHCPARTPRVSTPFIASGRFSRIWSIS
jgi:nucleoside diphosphate kinase